MLFFPNATICVAEETTEKNKEGTKIKKYDFETHEFSTELYAGPYYMKKKYPQSAFAKETYLEFENMMLPVMQGYEEYLSIAFGEYMELPPVEKQVPHHDLVELDLSKPCI